MQHRYDFIYLFDVRDGNPNGDPDAGNLPRVDAETGHGLVTDVCLKRKVRNFVILSHADALGKNAEDGKPGYDIYVREKAILNQQHERAYTAENPDATAKEGKRKGAGDQIDKARQWMCRNFYDVRTFGAVMSTGTNCGQVRGPVQLTFGRSIDPVVLMEHAVTRVAVTTEAESAKQQGDNRTMGRKFTIPYGLYRTHGFISAPLAADTGFSDADLGLFWKALSQMFDHDRSAARGEMSARALLVFKHQDRLGNAPAHRLFERITVARRDANEPARAFTDYEVRLDGEMLDQAIPSGQVKELKNDVTLMRLI
ncbi:type I-C CRISPR-associated protein Cas7/Csd2 [Thiocystis minor]|uniref:type I-C CRISPR-associated protein Cas7/Csd2 n=1 Tax=Thiocystis minor TaxID=61597 RepID=UPI001A927CA0|nr:type I-C CRISPR-associated protein Cas7/Csd2 [Thiocystis minor]MBK5966430.1 type I-C CRISPR-associated protein Cas7/Csd2 [Thiocystis minor]